MIPDPKSRQDDEDDNGIADAGAEAVEDIAEEFLDIGGKDPSTGPGRTIKDQPARR